MPSDNDSEPERIGASRIEYDEQGRKYMVSDKGGRHGTYESRILLTPGRRTTRNADLLFVEWQMREELRAAGEYAELERRQYAEPYDANVEREFLHRVANEVWSLPRDVTDAAAIAKLVRTVSRVDG